MANTHSQRPFRPCKCGISNEAHLSSSPYHSLDWGAKVLEKLQKKNIIRHEYKMN